MPATEQHTEHLDQSAKEAFSRQAPVFDTLFGNDPIVQYKRERVRKHVLKHLKAGSRVLELNCGTGEDAQWLASLGHRVTATDVSEAMISETRGKISAAIETLVCDFKDIGTTFKNQDFDYVYSNFGGLNCTDALEQVIHSIYEVLKPGGKATLVIMPGFCLWEFLLLFKGKFKTALRRFAGKKGAKAQVEGVKFRCWYYSPRQVTLFGGREFKPVDLEGLCTLVPPSYMQGFPGKYPKLYKKLQHWEEALKNKWPWRSIGDYYIITLQKSGSS